MRFIREFFDDSPPLCCFHSGMVRWPYGVGRVGKVRLTFKKSLLDFRCFRPSFTTLLSLLLCLVATLLSSFLIFLYSLFWFRRRRILVQCGDHLRLMLSFIWALTQRCLFLVGFQFKGAQTYRGEVLNTVPHLIRKQSRPFLTWKVTLYNYTKIWGSKIGQLLYRRIL